MFPEPPDFKSGECQSHSITTINITHRKIFRKSLTIKLISQIVIRDSSIKLILFQFDDFYAITHGN